MKKKTSLFLSLAEIYFTTNFIGRVLKHLSKVINFYTSECRLKLIMQKNARNKLQSITFVFLSQSLFETKKLQISLRFSSFCDLK